MSTVHLAAAEVGRPVPPMRVETEQFLVRGIPDASAVGPRSRESGHRRLKRGLVAEFFAAPPYAGHFTLGMAMWFRTPTTVARPRWKLDKLRAALAWCELDCARAVTGLRLAAQINWFWGTRPGSLR